MVPKESSTKSSSSARQVRRAHRALHPGRDRPVPTTLTSEARRHRCQASNPMPLQRTADRAQDRAHYLAGGIRGRIDCGGQRIGWGFCFGRGGPGSSVPVLESRAAALRSQRPACVPGVGPVSLAVFVCNLPLCPAVVSAGLSDWSPVDGPPPTMGGGAGVGRVLSCCRCWLRPHLRLSRQRLGFSPLEFCRRGHQRFGLSHRWRHTSAAPLRYLRGERCERFRSRCPVPSRLHRGARRLS